MGIIYCMGRQVRPKKENERDRAGGDRGECRKCEYFRMGSVLQGAGCEVEGTE